MSIETPIYDALQKYLSKSPIRMHVPFHNGIANNAVFPKGLYELDISEVSGFDLSGEENPIFQSEKITADFFNVSHSFYLVNGASIGLLASMIALRKYGKKVVLARNVHKSVLNGVVLAGLEPIWLEVDFLNEWGIFSKINPEKLEKLLKENTDIAGFVIVSPTYEGVISDVKAIADICHKKNIPLVVDEAHGTHLTFIEPNENHADLIIQSWHKSLGALSQTAVLHMANNKYFNYNDIKRSLDLVASTSPSFLLLLSLELTRKHAAEFGSAYLNALYSNAEKFRSELKKMENMDLFESDDLLKIYLRPTNIDGIDFAYELYKNYSIEIESANEIGFLMMIGVSFNDAVMNKVLDAVKNTSTLDLGTNKSFKSTKSLSVKQLVDPRKAFFQGFKNEALEYGCDIQAPCPPGYAVSIPGIKK
jgi:lysine decarboxylase